MLMKTTTLDSYELESLAALRREARKYGVKGGLLADPLSNPKVAKNAKESYVLTFPLHLAPANLSGYEVCPTASAGCRKACLHTAGNPAYMAGKTGSRIAKTKLFFENRPLFVAILRKEVQAANRKATKLGMALAFRLNATSDVKWESYKLEFHGLRFSIIELLHTVAPTAKFYDYTKIVGRKTPEYYTLTYSLSEDNDTQAASELARGHNVAVVFDTKRNHDLPSTYTIQGINRQVINGDLTDYRPDDPQGVIVGLRAKGDAIGDTSGFVRKANQQLFFAA